MAQFSTRLMAEEVGRNNEQPRHSHLWAVHFPNSNNGWAVGEKGAIVYTRNGGKNWLAQQSNTEQSLLGVHFADADTGWIVGANGLILHTANGGNTWERQTPPVKKTLRGVEFISPQQGWAIGEEGLILHTADGGKTWTTQPTSTTLNLLDIYLHKSRSWVVGSNGTILRRG